ncbi:phosphatidylserine synthase 1-like [Clavelina lepadiformis]|uniref:phosphatidylserine synthase 1-like n=1 Tax=Clavelina lepadiformis TaxID=159417 RepID=UPI0040419BAE
MQSYKNARNNKRYLNEGADHHMEHGGSLQYQHFSRLLVMFVILVTVLFIVVSRDESNKEANLINGAKCATFFYFLLGFLIFPQGPFQRPHPIVWQIVFGASLLYVLFMTYLTFLRIDQIRSILFWIDPNVKYAKREIDVVEEYAVNCSSVTIERLYSMLDIFAFGHFVGWIARALLLRSYVICWSISILWEFTELFFMDVFPNFQECWWDQILVDVLGFNALGIWMGMKLCKYLELRKYRWESVKDIQMGKLQRVMIQFTSLKGSSKSWLGMGSSTRRILYLFLLILLYILAELNAFFLKHFLRFPATHPFCWVRLMVHLTVGAPATRELYLHMTDITSAQQLPPQVLVYITSVFLETIVSIKIGAEEFTRTQSLKIISWLLVMVITTLACLSGLVFICKLQRGKKGKCVYDSTDDSCWEKVGKSE